MSRRILVLGLVAYGVLASVHSAMAYDAGTTHAGLTARALKVSTLVQRIGSLFGLPGGLYEPLRFEPTDERGRQLRARLDRLDPAGGYAPDGGRLPARGWLVAGSVIEEVPAIRRRNHFLDATTGSGLHQRGVWAGIGRGMAVAGGLDSVRDLFAGDAFDGTGMASTEWLSSPANDLGLPRFLDARERAVAAAGPAEREAALAEALLAAGAILHVVEDAADPAYVHNDFIVDLYRRGAPYDVYVAAAYGRIAVPPPAGPARPVSHLAELIHDGAGNGLADRTARRFYSLGLLVGDEVAISKPAAATRPAELPPLTPGAEARGYLLDAQHRRIARYRRTERGDLAWDLDTRCYADAASVLLPEAGQAALSALEHLFRDPLTVESGAVKNGSIALGAGKIRVLREDSDGTRRVSSTRDVTSVAAGETLAELPPGASRGHRATVVFRGVDGVGEPIVVSIEATAATE